MSKGEVTRRRSWSILAMTLAVVLLVSLLGAWFFYKDCEERLGEVHYKARILSVSPSVGCIAMARELGAGVVSGILGAVTGLGGDSSGDGKQGQGVDESGEGGDHGQESEVNPDDSGARGRQATPCTVEVVTGLAVDNPLPVTMEVRILSVEAKVARSTISQDAIEVTPRPVTAVPGGQASLRVGLRFNLRQLMVAAGGLMLTRKMRVKAKLVVGVSVLWGLIEQERDVEIERALTVEDIIRGVDGNVGGK